MNYTTRKKTALQKLELSKMVENLKSLREMNNVVNTKDLVKISGATAKRKFPRNIFQIFSKSK